jgi:hypothetical protein
LVNQHSAVFFCNLPKHKLPALRPLLSPKCHMGFSILLVSLPLY